MASTATATPTATATLTPRISEDVLASLLEKYPKIMKLRVFVDSASQELKDEYVKRVTQHNEKLFKQPNHIDAGFDLLCPDDKPKSRIGSLSFTLDTEIKCAAEMLANKIILSEYNKDEGSYFMSEPVSYNTGFYLYPRSSISKRPFILANSVGVIDASYRGNIKAVFHLLYPHVESEGADIPLYNKHDRYVQICAPDLAPIYVELVETLAELGEQTARGEGGFGSTGK